MSECQIQSDHTYQIRFHTQLNTDLPEVWITMKLRQPLDILSSAERSRAAGMKAPMGFWSQLVRHQETKTITELDSCRVGGCAFGFCFVGFFLICFAFMQLVSF